METPRWVMDLVGTAPGQVLLGLGLLGATAVLWRLADVLQRLAERVEVITLDEAQKKFSFVPRARRAGRSLGHRPTRELAPPADPPGGTPTA